MFFLCLLYSLCVMLFIILTQSEWSSRSIIFFFAFFRIYIFLLGVLYSLCVIF